MKQSKIAAFKYHPFSKKQRKVLNWWTEKSPVKDADGIIADGAIRSGKSSSMSLSFALWAMNSFDGQNFAMCGKTVGSFRRNVLFWLKIMLKGRGYDVQDSRSENLCTVTDGERTNYFYIFGGKDERSQDLIQGITLAGIFLDEVALMPESFVNQATGRCSVDGSKMWFNCNPSFPSHWFKVKWIDKAKDKNLLYLHFNMDDNLSLSEKTKARYRTMYSGVFFDRFILGLWVLAEGIIYPMYKDAIEEPPDERAERYCISIDYGTQNAFSVSLWGKYGNVWHIVDEYYYSGRETGVQKTDTEYGDDLDKFLDEHQVTGTVYTVIDPSAASFITLLRKKTRYRVKKAKNDVSDGIRDTAVALKKGLIKVSPVCKRTIEEFGGYVWDDTEEEDKPVKVNDHCLTADTMVMTESGEKPISELIGTKGRVWSYNTETETKELKPYSDCRLTQKQAKIFKIKLSDGRFIRCTEDHPILTERGYIKAKDLNSTDRIIDIS